MVTKYRPNGFVIKELVDEETYNSLGEAAWNLISIKTLITLDTLKRLTGWTVIVNTWSFKTDKYGRFSQRGFRASYSTTGLKTGAHYKGLAFDCDCYRDGVRVAPNEVRNVIFQNIEKFEYIRCIETDINWVHIDCMGWEDSDKRLGITHKNILLWSPKTGSKVFTRDAIKSLRL